LITNNSFWEKLDQLINKSEIIIDRPRGSAHPKFPKLIYPINYGYLEETSGSDGNEIDVWNGSCNKNNLTAVICTVDTLKKDCELKLLVDCNEEEAEIILKFYNESEYMSAILIKRNN
jgi:inorganic pyrophosphatase